MNRIFFKNDGKNLKNFGQNFGPFRGFGRFWSFLCFYFPSPSLRFPFSMFLRHVWSGLVRLPPLFPLFLTFLRSLCRGVSLGLKSWAQRDILRRIGGNYRHFANTLAHLISRNFELKVSKMNSAQNLRGFVIRSKYLIPSFKASKIQKLFAKISLYRSSIVSRNGYFETFFDFEIFSKKIDFFKIFSFVFRTCSEDKLSKRIMDLISITGV